MAGSPREVTHIEEVVPFLDLTPQDNQAWQIDCSFFHFYWLHNNVISFFFIVIILFIFNLYCYVTSSFVSFSISCFLADSRHIFFCCCYITPAYVTLL